MFTFNPVRWANDRKEFLSIFAIIPPVPLVTQHLGDEPIDTSEITMQIGEIWKFP